MNLLLISIGAIFGAISRWQLGIWLNTYFQSFALGTLLANWLGCFLIGIAMGFNLHEQQKLLFITGFLGSFTTFSSLCAEVSEKLFAAEYSTALYTLSLHLFGGIILTVLGIGLVKIIFG